MGGGRMSEILAIDANRSSLSFVHSTLKEAGHRVAAANDPAEALDALAHVRFDLVICPTSTNFRNEHPQWQLPASLGYQPLLLLIQGEPERETPHSVACLRRPFDAGALAAAVRDALGEQ